MKKKMNEKRTNYYLRIFQNNRILLTFNILITIIASAGGAAIALLLKNIIDIAVSGDISKFTKSLLFNMGYLLVLALVCYCSSLLSKILIRNVIKNLRKSEFSGIFKRNYKDFYEVNTADYISVLTNDIKMIEENYIEPLMVIIGNLLSFAFTLGLLLFISPMITIILFIGLAFMLLIPGAIGKKLQMKQEILSGGYSIFTSKIKDMFSGFEVIKSFFLFGIMKEQFNDENDTLAVKKFETDKLFVLNETTSQFLAVYTQIITIFAAAYLVIKGSITIGTLTAVMQLSASFVMPLVYIMQNFPKIQSVAPIMKRMQEFDEYTDTSFTGTSEPKFDDRIVLSNVSFAYHEEQPVLDKINMEIEKGKKYAIVGESGCGKSTLVKLLIGYYPDYSGKILYDNMSLKECEVGKISQLVSIIHQNVYMFDKTILDNICLFQNYELGTIERAIEQSGVDKFLPDTQKQLETMVGENGANLSGGQRQRIAIARALVKETPILILDEGTSAIDMQTSNNIEQSLINNENLTLITITHKLNEDQLSLYDQIIFMEKGRIVEVGSYSDLYAVKKKFYHFCVA